MKADAAHYVALGNAALAQGDTWRAVQHYQRAHQLLPEAPDILYNLANALHYDGRSKEAVRCYRALVRLAPNDEAAWYNYGHVLEMLGRQYAARRVYQQAIRLNPKAVSARHRLAALRHEKPSRAPQGYVARLFNTYAASFEAELLGDLAYQLPQQLPAHLPETLGDILDLGCGTGLMARALAGRYQAIDGVDIAPAMLAQAEASQCYRTLYCGDFLTDTLPFPAARYHCVIAADALPYVGDVAVFLQRCHRLLQPDGQLVFSVEGAPWWVRDYRLRRSGRFQHGSRYLRHQLQQAGFHACRAVRTPLRLEKGKPIGGVLWIAQASK